MFNVSIGYLPMSIPVWVTSEQHYSKLMLTDENYNTWDIVVGQDENESFVHGQSSTHTAKAHEFLLGEDLLVRAIDTPAK